MDCDDVRDLVRIRHELRRLAAHGEAASAEPLLDRLTVLAERDPRARADVEPELQRWRSVFRL